MSWQEIWKFILEKPGAATVFLVAGLAVLGGLAKAGYPQELMYPTGWGDILPVSTNNSEAGKANNRRVEILIDPAASGIFGNVAITVAAPVGDEGPKYEFIDDGRQPMEEN